MRKAICLGVADDMRRLAACVEISNRPQRHAVGGDNCLIGWTQKLLRAVYNRTAALYDRGILNVEDSPHAIARNDNKAAVLSSRTLRLDAQDKLRERSLTEISLGIFTSLKLDRARRDMVILRVRAVSLAR